MSLVEARDVWKEFVQPGQNVVALRGVDLEIQRGDLVVITGESGSGKTTLLSLLGALDHATRGTIRLFDEALESAPSGRLARLRRERIGFIFQDFLLVRHLSAIDNVRLPLLFSRRLEDKDRARNLAERFHVGHRLKLRPNALSRGEMQRLALARALVNRPDLLLADEPTANLDRRNRDLIWNYLVDLNRTDGLSVIIATHNADLEREASRVIRLKDGAIESDESRAD